jgi:molybdopterin converting factor subunit 1
LKEPTGIQKGSSLVHVSVRLFALARQKAGRSELTLELPATATVADLRRELARSSPDLAPLVPNLMIAVDSEYADDDRPIGAGAEVAVIPPVSGGAPSARFPLLETLRPIR